MRMLFNWLQISLLNSVAPRYIALAEAINKAIELQYIKLGHYLPTERELAKQLRLSRVTVSKAMYLLQRQGVISREQGRGTKVISLVQKQFHGNFKSQEKIPLCINYSLQEDEGLTQQMSKYGIKITNQWLRRDKCRCSEELLSRYNVNDQIVSHLKRVRLAENTPVSVENTYIPACYLPEPDKLEHSLYAWWQSQGIVPQFRQYRIQAVASSREIAALLQIVPDQPLLRILQTSRNVEQQLVELSEVFCRSDLYQFEIHN